MSTWGAKWRRDRSRKAPARPRSLRFMVIRVVHVGLAGAAGAQQGLHFERGDRAAEVVALQLVATVLAQELEVRKGYDALGHHLEPERMAERDDGPHDGGIVGVAVDVAHETLVDLEAVDGKTLEIAEAGIAGAEIVHRNVDAQRLQRLHGDIDALGIVHDEGLGQFQSRKAGSSPACARAEATACTSPV